MVELKFEAPRKNELLALPKFGDNGKDESIPVRSAYPQHPVPCFQVTGDFDSKKAKEIMRERDVKVAKSLPNDIIIPDPARQVPRVEVFQHVSSILKEYGFFPIGDSLDTINLRPYDCKKTDGESCKGLTDANMAVTKTANLDAAEEKVTTVGNDSLSLMARQCTTQRQVQAASSAD